MNEGCFVETFNGDRDFANIVREFRAGVIPQRLECGNCEERPPSFAGAAEPLAGNPFRFAFAIAHHKVQRGWREPEINFVTQRA